MSLQYMTECERIVMKCVWDAGKDVSLVELMDALQDHFHKDWKRQTVSTFLLHLIQKGFLSSYRVGRVFYYHCEVELDDYKEWITEAFVSFWYGDSTDPLYAFLEKRDK